MFFLYVGIPLLICNIYILYQSSCYIFNINNSPHLPAFIFIGYGSFTQDEVHFTQNKLTKLNQFLNTFSRNKPRGGIAQQGAPSYTVNHPKGKGARMVLKIEYFRPTLGGIAQQGEHGIR